MMNKTFKRLLIPLALVLLVLIIPYDVFGRAGGGQKYKAPEKPDKPKYYTPVKRTYHPPTYSRPVYPTYRTTPRPYTAPSTPYTARTTQYYRYRPQQRTIVIPFFQRYYDRYSGGRPCCCGFGICTSAFTLLFGAFSLVALKVKL